MKQMKIDSYTIQVARTTTPGRSLWRTLRHKDGAKPIMTFEKRQQARQHCRKLVGIVFTQVRIRHPDGKLEPVGMALICEKEA